MDHNDLSKACGKRIHHLNCHTLSSSLVQFHPVALSEHLLIWSYLQFFSQDCCELTCPHPIFPYDILRTCSYSPSQPFQASLSLRRCCLQLLHSWLGTQQDQGDRDWPERRGPRRVPSRAERLRPRPTTGSMEILAFRASVRFAVAANIYKQHMICLAQQKQQMKKLPHLQTHIHQNSCKNFKSCSLQNQFGAGMLHSFVRQLSSSYMQGWICGQRGER